LGIHSRSSVSAGDMSLRVLNSVSLGTRSRRSVTPQLRRLVIEGTVKVPSIEYVEAVNKKKLLDILPFVSVTSKF